MKLVVFAGQGSQYKGMGKELFSKFPEKVIIASNILGFDVKELCLEDPDKQLNLTQYTQPALYVVNALRWLDKKDSLGQVDYLMGHSLGEYNALLAAQAFDFETGLKLVQERGRLMGEAGGGGMIAVLNTPADELQKYLEDNGLTALDIANYNTAKQLVISGPKDIAERAVSQLRKDKIRAMPLKVSAAFHSRYMQKAAEEFYSFIEHFDFSPLAIPVIANTTARPYNNDKIIETLAKQIDHSVLWTESVRFLMGKDKDFTFVELGKNLILSKMINEIRQEEQPLYVEEEKTVQKETVEKQQDAEVAKPQQQVKQETQQPTTEKKQIQADELGAKSFQQKYGIKYAYLTGAMYRGIASKELVVAMGKSGLLGFLGTGGMSLSQIENDLRFIQQQLDNHQTYGMNLLFNLQDPELEMDTVELYLKYGVTNIEAAAFMMMTPALVYYRLQGLEKDSSGKIHCKHRILAKVSRPEVAEKFMSPAPKRIVNRLLEKGKITSEQAQMAEQVAMSFDICVEADSGGHTDQGISTVLLPAIQSLKKEMQGKYNYEHPIHVGLSGGIGTPESAASAFVMGADFILTGSINQCTVEAGMSDVVKTMLQDINVQDTAYAPAGDMFEIGAKVQVLKRGVFFPARANKLYMLYTHYNSLDEIPSAMKKQLQEKYFHKTFAEIWRETKDYFQQKGDAKNIEQAEKNPKHKMALVFRWYFSYSLKLAFAGDESDKVNFQVHTGPALGAFNQWVKGTEFASWQNRHVHKIAEKMMTETAELLSVRISPFYEALVKEHEQDKKRIAALEKELQEYSLKDFTQESGARSQESGDKSQGSGDKRQESGDKSQNLKGDNQNKKKNKNNKKKRSGANKTQEKKEVKEQQHNTKKMETKKRASKDEIFSIIGEYCKEVLGDLDDYSFKFGDSLKTLGANSIDRAEIVGLTLEFFELDFPRTELFGAKNMGELAELIYEKQ